jgi:CTD small phosphatase-like protein 2
METPCLPRPDSARISIPEDNEVEVEEPISDEELEEANKASTTKKFITGDTSASLSCEVISHFNTICEMSLTMEEEISKRAVELCKTPKGSSGKTLVLDMDDTLIHTLIPIFNYSKIKFNYNNPKTVMYKDEGTLTLYTAKVIIRPYALELLKELSKLYEIVIFTAVEKCYADAILDLLDPEKKYISYRIYRENCIIKERGASKDLRIFKNRDLDKMIIVDNTISCFADHLSNGIHVPTYYGQKEDNSLEKVLNLLKEIASCSNVQRALDERVGLRELYNQFVKSN